MFEGAFGGRGAWVPAVDVYETPSKDLVLRRTCPDLKREDIKVTFENDVLTIAGERALRADVAAEAVSSARARARRL